jgi:transposase
MEWLPPYSAGISMSIVGHRVGRTAIMTTDIMIGIDLAKNVFQIHGTSMAGQIMFRKKLSRQRFRKFMAEHPAAVVVMEV